MMRSGEDTAGFFDKCRSSRFNTSITILRSDNYKIGPFEGGGIEPDLNFHYC